MTANNDSQSTPKMDLPDLTFESKTARWEGQISDCTRALKIKSRDSFEDAVLSSTPLKSVQWAPLFAYMHRRFGPPHVPADEYKDLSAGWMLTSKDPNLFVSVSPSLSGAGFSLAPYYKSSEAEMPPFEEMQITPEHAEIAKEAYRVTLLDLLRPVCVRDNHINAMGKVDHNTKSGNKLLEYNEDEDEQVYAADRHPSSGCAMPSGLFGGKEWGALCSMVNQLGNGDAQAGRTALIGIVREHLLQEIATSVPPIVKQTMLLFSEHDERDILVKGFKLTTQEMQNLAAQEKSLSSLKGKAHESKVLDQLTIKDAELARDHLLKLGLETKHMMFSIERLLLDRSTTQAYKNLCKVGDKDFPDNGLPEKTNLPAAEIAAHMREVFRESKRPELEQWLDETLARPMGDQCLERIIDHVQKQTKEKSAKHKNGPK